MVEHIAMSEVLGIILGGGLGERIRPLTKERSKLAVPVAGNMRIVDFVLTNFIRSEIKKIYITIAYKSDSLMAHIESYWKFLPTELGEFVRLLPPQKRTDEEEYYVGSANAAYQNMYFINKINPKIVAVFSGDHIYYMDIRQMIHHHIDKNAEVTVCATPIKINDASRDHHGHVTYGVIVADENQRIVDFQEKPLHPAEIPGMPGYFWASMGNYLFQKNVLQNALEADNEDEMSGHDFGVDIIPLLMQEHKRVYMYDFSQNEISGATAHEKGFWMDVGTIENYYDTNMMFTSIHPKLNLYNKQWALMKPPSKTVHSANIRKELESHRNKRIAGVYDSLISEGCIISGATIINTVISPDVRVHSYATVLDSMILSGVDIGEYCEIKNAIIDKNVKIPRGARIGYDLELDEARGFKIIKSRGIVIVPKDYKFREE